MVKLLGRTTISSENSVIFNHKAFKLSFKFRFLGHFILFLFVVNLSLNQNSPDVFALCELHSGILCL